MVNLAENFARRIVERLQGAGHVAYFAGGCVRDRLMGRAPKDFDVATSARPEEVLKIFPRGQQVGAAFGVILLVEKPPGAGGKRLQVEVATFRTDGTYSDGRHPDSVEFTTAEQDARRRDFSCNGLFWDPLAKGGQGELHDFVGGQADIAAKVLRAIGDPAARFGEDHLRMLRAVRFAARLRFAIEPETAEAIRRLAPNIRTVSKERVHDELAAILSHPSRAKGARLLQSTGLLEHLWPKELVSIAASYLRVFGAFLISLPPNADFVMALVALFRELADDHMQAALSGGAVAEFLRRDLMLSNVETADFAWFLDKLKVLGTLDWSRRPKSVMKRLLADPRWERLEYLFKSMALPIDWYRDFETRIGRLRREGVSPAPLVSGDTLISLGAVPGPSFRTWLEELYDRQLEGELKTAEEALAAARALVKR